MRSLSTIVAMAMLLGASTVSGTQPKGTVGCYSKLDGYIFNSTYIYQSDGWCRDICNPGGYSNMATTKGTDCWCGNSVPSASNKVADTICNTKCAGFGDTLCGGSRSWTVYMVDANAVVPAASSSSSSSATSTSDPGVLINSPSATKSAAPSVVTVGGQTVVVTAGSSTTNIPSDSASASVSSESKSSGPSKAAIAAGVVVGVVAIAAIAGGAFIFIRNKKRREVEEEYRRNAAVSSFIAGGGKPPTSSGGASSFNDTRLDPSVIAQRRMSDGSIADNQDYSRRILKVTNA
ncbi:hypothetical protein BJ875DRAFT_506930 [Amylocarpus encephaloides]|uniref:WSC domain-containing protein n=1 Tax=Amylocarpus encephaloides TaxID=45428 RepID=A0A9P8C257_9HELO|nr:hypothetical protein BJ875DRAFT_506930 [Amylocarpus encephaloides]